MTPVTKKAVTVCDTCPWLVSMQGKNHPAKWYSAANLKALWNGLRTGKAPGMVCHASDPGSKDYGSTKTVHPDAERRHCAGSLILLIRHANDLGKCKNYKDYRSRHKYPVSRGVIASVLWRHMTGSIPGVSTYRADEVDLPESMR